MSPTLKGLARGLRRAARASGQGWLRPAVSLLLLFTLTAPAAELSGLAKPGDENDFPYFRLRWTNQGSPKQLVVEDYLVTQKFGLDDLQLRRREVRSYDARGFMVFKLVYGREGVLEGAESNSADAQGFAAESVRIRGLAEVQYKWVYKRTNVPVPGLLTEEIRYQADGSIHSRNYFQHDSRGLETNRLLYNHTGLLEFRQAQVWDSNRNPVERILHRGTGTIQEKVAWAWSNGLLRSESWFNMEGELVRRTRWEYTNGRAPGQKSGEWVYKGDGELRERTEYRYDATGRLTEQRSVDGVSQFRSRMTNAYDAQGRKAEETWFQNAETPGWRYTYARDARGNPTELRRYEYNPRFGEISWDLSQLVKISYTY